MNKSIKVLLAVVMALAICTVSFYFGMRYEKNVWELDKQNEYANRMKEELTSLSVLLSAESFDKEDIEAILSSLLEVRSLAESAAEYTNDKVVIEQAEDFAVAVHVLGDLLEHGITYDNITYSSFLNYESANEKRIIFLNELGDDFNLVTLNIENGSIDFSAISIKYGPDMINDTINNANTGRSLNVSIEGYPINLVVNNPYQYKSNSMVFTPSMYILCNGEQIKADFSTSVWSIYLDNQGILTLDYVLDKEKSLDKVENIKTEIYYYPDSFFQIQFDFKPEEYSVYELKEDGSMIKLEHDLSSPYSVKFEGEAKYYYVEAFWEQGTVNYAFKSKYVCPADWSDYEKAD